MPAISRYDSLEAAADAAADIMASALEAGLERRGAASLVATGGSTPGPVYDRLATRALDWGKVGVTLSDERWVGAGDPASNEAMVRSRLLTGRAADARFTPLKTPDATPGEAAAKVEQSILALPRPFDAVLLGMGEDGHIASLFPGMEGLAAALDPESPSLVAVAEPGADGRPPREARLGLTLSALASAGSVVVFIVGAAKWAALQKALTGDDELEMPVRALLNSGAPVRIVWAP